MTAPSIDHGNDLRRRMAGVLELWKLGGLSTADALDELELTLVRTSDRRTITGRVRRVGGDLSEAPGPTVEVEVSIADAQRVARHIYSAVSLITPSERELADEAARRG